MFTDDQTPGNLIYDKPLHSNVSTEPLIERKLVCYYSNSASENNSNKSENIHLDKIGMPYLDMNLRKYLFFFFNRFQLQQFVVFFCRCVFVHTH